MKRLLSPWMALGFTAILLASWAFTIGPLGPWHLRTLTVTGVIRANAPRESFVSAPARFHGAESTVRASLEPVVPPGGERTVIGYVAWRLWLPDRKYGPAGSFDFSTLAPGPSTDTVGAVWGERRLVVTAQSTVASRLVASISTPRDVYSGVSLGWPALFVGAAYLGFALVWPVRGKTRPFVVAPRHEHY